MAECSKSKTDVIHCPICFKIFENPKWLPCLHTFCQLCLQEHIRVTSIIQGGKTMFKCPFCREVLQTSGVIEDPKELASKIPTNHLIVSLIDKEKLNPEDKPCDPCLLLGEKRKAISWCITCSEALCDTCKKCHVTNKMSRHHTLAAIEDIDKFLIWATSDQFCEEHTNKKLELFCVDHDQVCCLTCKTTSHKTCHRILGLEEAVQDFQESSEMDQICTKMSDVSEEFEKLLQNRKENLTSTENDKKQLLQEIKKVRQRIQEHLDLTESQLLTDLEVQHTQITLQIKDEIRDLESRQQTTDECRKIFEVCKSQPNNVRMFIEKKKLEKKYKEQKEFLRYKVVNLKDITFKFHASDKAKAFQAHLTSLGTITVEKNVNVTFSGIKDQPPLKECKAVKISSFDIRQSCTITGAVFVNDELLALVGLNYPAILLYDCRGNLKQEVRLSKNPFDITVVGNFIIVTYSRDSRLTFFRVGSMEIVRTVSLIDECRGVCSYNEIIVVNCYPRLNFIDTSGNLVRKFDIKGDAHYIAASQHAEGAIFCSYMSPTCVNAFDLAGNQKFRYSNPNLDNPVGLSSDREGNVYVPGYRSHNIHQISPDGELIKVILNIDNDIEHPRIVSFDKNSDRFLVAHGGSRIKIFQMMK